jgi:transposase
MGYTPGMSRRVDFTLTVEPLAEIEPAINYSPHPEVRQRAIAIRLLDRGHRPEEVAEMVMVKANSIWTWQRRWRQGGITALQDQPKSGRPRKGTPEYGQVLDEALKSDPASYGYRFTIWTMDRLREPLEQQTGIRLSRTDFAILLEREGSV